MSVLPPLRANATIGGFAPGPGPLLSWNSARLLALVLNALAGLLGFYGGESALEPDSLFALRFLQGYLGEIDSAFDERGFHPAILLAVKNLSLEAGEIAFQKFSPNSDNLPANWRRSQSDAMQNLLNRAHKVDLPAHKKVDENLRWSSKDILSRDSRHASSGWFDENAVFDCALSLFDTTQKNGKSKSVRADCFSKMLLEKGRIGFTISRQLFFVALAKMAGHFDELGAFLRRIEQNANNNLTNAQFAENYVAERCANIRDEMAHFRRDKKKLARVAVSASLDLLMEQVFVCLQFGYVEFAEPHVLVMALAWQNPTLGCYTARKPESVPNMGISADFGHAPKPGLFAHVPVHSTKDDACLHHTSSAVAVALAVFLRFLLDPGPWPEFHFAEQLVQIDQIVAEDRFRHFRYVEWIRDSYLHLPIQPPHPDGTYSRQLSAHKMVPKPPPMTWSPDLIAFVALLFIFIVGSVIAHHFFSPRRGEGTKIGGKRVYPYAFKKL